MSQGCLFWITGLSGAGKSTLAQRLFSSRRKDRPNTVLLDGDALRQVYGLEGHYTFDERLGVAKRHARMCHLLTTQGMDVICPTISMFDEVRKWNRNNQKSYIEIFIDARRDVLQKRRGFNYTTESEFGGRCHVVGTSVKAEYPQNPDVVLLNNGDSGIEPVYKKLMDYLNEREQQKRY